MVVFFLIFFIDYFLLLCELAAFYLIRAIFNFVCLIFSSIEYRRRDSNSNSIRFIFLSFFLSFASTQFTKLTLGEFKSIYCTFSCPQSTIFICNFFSIYTHRQLTRFSFDYKFVIIFFLLDLWLQL